MLRYQSYKNPEELAVFQQGVQRWTERVGNVEVQTDIVPQGEYIEKLLVRIMPHEQAHERVRRTVARHGLAASDEGPLRA